MSNNLMEFHHSDFGIKFIFGTVFRQFKKNALESRESKNWIYDLKLETDTDRTYFNFYKTVQSRLA